MKNRTPLDDSGQPVNRRLNAARLSDRAVDELIGMCRGFAADKNVSRDEARYLLSWVESNRDYATQWPANVLYARIREMLEDDVLDSSGQAELLLLLHKVVGGELPIAERVASYSSSLPLDENPPKVIFPGRSFCMTGKFVFGSRNKCHDTVRALGGEVHPAPKGITDYLVIGAIGSEA